MSWTGKLLPRSLRSRLILSFGALIFLSLFLAGAATVVLLKEQQDKNASEKVGLLARPVALQAALYEANRFRPDQIEVLLQEQYGVRILLLDSSSTVVADSGNTLRGRTIGDDRGPAPGSQNRGIETLKYRIQKLEQGDEKLVLFAAPKAVATNPDGSIAFEPQYQAIIAVPASEVQHAWRDLLPRLFLAGGVAFFVGVIAAGIIARSITRPLRAITAASEEMAKGRYDQQLPAYGGDEVRRLGIAFNDMSQQVGRSHRTLRDFLANVSHELKTPLTSIQGFSQALVDGAADKREDAVEAARIINDEAVRMRGLVDDLLYLSQVESGEFNIQRDQLNPNDLLDATRERFERRAEQAGVHLVVETQSTPRIDADARRLEQALANIVDNAVRHTPKGGFVSLRSSASDGHVSLAVHNTGSVIPAEALPKIFDRFFQADPQGARSDSNTGLGLAITKEIVDAHGGEVTVTSTFADGTEFVITLPLSGETATT
ncbi:MAG TPA: HAMP domain-containing sensor histidine kinase [Dehalococcoidia bacterium]|nr:HAMP domain-containing sensor histidine kinase [Dehalococcoidia bacterium]